jgi:hypothetical protein
MKCLGFQPPGLCRRSCLWLVLALWLASGWALLAQDAATQSKADSSHAAAPCPTFRVRPQDEIWVFSTRCLGCPSTEIAPAWTVWKYEPQTPRWLNATADEFFKRDAADAVTVVHIHGNLLTQSEALGEGLDVYFQLAGCWDDEPPVRFVIWSWPSEKTRGPLRDVRRKASRSDVEACYLGQFLDQVPPDRKVGLLGYSFGARIAAGAMHLLGGGELLGQTIAARDRLQIRVAFWAAAEHDDWLLPGRCHGRALELPAHWFITRNCCDPVLAHYDLLEKCSNPAALGYSGLVGRNLLTAEQNARIEEMDVTHLVGRVHSMDRYLYSPAIMDRTRAYVLWHELAAR